MQWVEGKGGPCVPLLRAAVTEAFPLSTQEHPSMHSLRCCQAAPVARGLSARDQACAGSEYGSCRGRNEHRRLLGGAHLLEPRLELKGSISEGSRCRTGAHNSCFKGIKGKCAFSSNNNDNNEQVRFATTDRQFSGTCLSCVVRGWAR